MINAVSMNHLFCDNKQELFPRCKNTASELNVISRLFILFPFVVNSDT